MPTLIAFLIIYATLFLFFKPSLLFSLTTTAGGDTGAHHYPAQYLIQELLPNFRLTGWAPGWYAGMPMLTFYFPFPFLLIAILDWVLPYLVAFKIGTVLGIFALPATAYAMGRLWRVRRPFPIMAAVFALVFLFMEYDQQIYGGNVLSTLAGEFGYMLSFALVFLFLGTMCRGMEKPRFNMLFVLNCLILMALALSHIVTTVVLVCIVPGLLLVNFRWRALGYLAAVALVGFCLTAFWSIPFAIDLRWTAHMAWDQYPVFWKLLPKTLIAPGVLGFIGMAFAVARKERKLLPLAWITVASVVVFAALPEGRMWNMRIAPFFWFSIHLWAAYGVAWLVRPFVVIIWDLFRLRGWTARRIYVPVVASVAALALLFTCTIAGGFENWNSGWIHWNYSGYEDQGKTTWSEYKEINDFLDTLPPHSRVMVEHEADKINALGTARAFELIPYWTRADTMEGTLMEASYTAAFHFINQSELSEPGEASDAIIGVKYPGINVTRGLTHLQFMNIPYLLTAVGGNGEERITTEVQADPRAELLATFNGGEYNIFRISGCNGYVEVMKNEPVRVQIEQSEWRDMANQWYLEEDALDTAIVWDNGEEALQQFASITPDQATDPPEVPIDTEGYVTNEMLSNESLEFDTTAIGEPHWIKISYFPNWHVEGAEGPFLASPSFMMVIPTQSHVTLYYGRTAANTVGQVLEVLAWALLLGLTVWRGVLWRRRKRLAGAVQESAPIPGYDADEQWLGDPEIPGVGAESADDLDSIYDANLADAAVDDHSVGDVEPADHGDSLDGHEWDGLGDSLDGDLADDDAADGKERPDV